MPSSTPSVVRWATFPSITVNCAGHRTGTGNPHRPLLTPPQAKQYENAFTRLVESFKTTDPESSTAKQITDQFPHLFPSNTPLEFNPIGLPERPEVIKLLKQQFVLVDTYRRLGVQLRNSEETAEANQAVLDLPGTRDFIQILGALPSNNTLLSITKRKRAASNGVHFPIDLHQDTELRSTLNTWATQLEGLPQNPLAQELLKIIEQERKSIGLDN